MNNLAPWIHQAMETMQRTLLEAATARREAASLRNPTDKAQMIEFLEGGGGFVYAGWCGDPAVEAEIKEQTKATIRVIPAAEFRSEQPPTRCIWTGQPARHEVVWAKAY